MDATVTDDERRTQLPSGSIVGPVVLLVKAERQAGRPKISASASTRIG
jgi:hypothetical protein